MNPISRRALLAIGLGWFTPTSRAQAPISVDGAVVAALVRIFTDGGGARHLGRQYLLSRPGASSDPCALSRRIFATLTERTFFLAASEDQRRRIIVQRIVEDFASGRVIELEGWVLAETEATVCAIVGNA